MSIFCFKFRSVIYTRPVILIISRLHNLLTNNVDCSWFLGKINCMVPRWNSCQTHKNSYLHQSTEGVFYFYFILSQNLLLLGNHQFTFQFIFSLLKNQNQ
jgi:hypothetical protein